MTRTNTNWTKWSKRGTIADKDQPAIYFIAHSDLSLEGKEFSFDEEIIYIGMTISNKGLKGRLDQFEKAMRGVNKLHGGAERVRFVHGDADLFFQNAYVSACIFKLSKDMSASKEWSIKGDCVGYEYKAFAEYLDRYNRLPEFNDYKRSKKK